MLGAGSALFFAPMAATVLGAVTPHEQGQASGAATAVRELAVVLGIAVLGRSSPAAATSTHRPGSSPVSCPHCGSPPPLQGPACHRDGAARNPGPGTARSAAARRAEPGAGAGTDMPEHPQLTSSLSCRAGRDAPRDPGRRPADHAAIRTSCAPPTASTPRHHPAGCGAAYLADLLDLDRHARHGQLAGRRRRRGRRRLRGLLPGRLRAGIRLAGRLGRRARAGGASRSTGATASPRRCWPTLEDRARAAGAPAFAFHTSAFMTTAVALYERLGYSARPRVRHRRERPLRRRRRPARGLRWPTCAV